MMEFRSVAYISNKTTARLEPSSLPIRIVGSGIPLRTHSSNETTIA